MTLLRMPKNLQVAWRSRLLSFRACLGDVDVAVINGNYAIEAGLKVTDALVTEDSQSIAATTYGNVVAVRAGEEKSDATLALIDALTSDTVKKYIEDTYQGAVVPLF